MTYFVSPQKFSHAFFVYPHKNTGTHLALKSFELKPNFTGGKMSKFSKLLKTSLIIAMSLFLINCGSSDEEKLVKEHNSLAQEINAMGVPSLDWSEKKLKGYISKLNKLERLNDEADSEEGVYGGYGNESVIESKRSYAYTILSRKRSLLSHQDKSEKIQELLSELTEEREDLIDSFSQLDMLSTKDMTDYLTRVEQVITKSNQTERLIKNYTGLDADTKTKMLNIVVDSNRAVVELRDSVKTQIETLASIDEDRLKDKIANDPKSLEAYGMSIVRDMLTLMQNEEALDMTDKSALVAHHKDILQLKDNMETWESMITNSKDIPQHKKEKAVNQFQPAKAQIDLAEKNILSKILAFDLEEVSTEEAQDSAE